MGFFNFFHNIKIGLKRLFELSLPDISEEKHYGDSGEAWFAREVQSYLPDCKIKQNIIIQTAEGNAEIDCLILYKNKLFAIEVKCWKGQIVERGGDIFQYKRDRWTDEIHTKVHNSPFKQLRRSVYLLKKQIQYSAWVNDVLFFKGSDDIQTESDSPWFDDVGKLALYISEDGKPSPKNNARLFFEKCVTTDYICSRSGEETRRYIICDDSLRFTTSDGVLDRRSISSIQIEHHWSYDNVKITTKDGNDHTINIENGSVYLMENGRKLRCALCKLNYIRPADLG